MQMNINKAYFVHARNEEIAVKIIYDSFVSTHIRNKHLLDNYQAIMRVASADPKDVCSAFHSAVHMHGHPCPHKGMSPIN